MTKAETCEQLEKRMDELARQYHATHDPRVKTEIEELSRGIGALRVLTDVLNRCRREDMRTPEVFAALDYLAAHAHTKWPFEQFRTGLDSREEEGRWQILNASLNGIKLAVEILP